MNKEQNLTNLVAEISRYAIHETTDNIARDVSKLQKISVSLTKYYSFSDKTEGDYSRIRRLEDKAVLLAKGLEMEVSFDFTEGNEALVLYFAGREKHI